MSYLQNITKNRRQSKLVAPKLPEGKSLYITPGVSDDAARLEAYARKCGDCPAEIFIVPAESVALEWHIEGKQMGWSDHYRTGLFCVLVNDLGLARAEPDLEQH